MASAPTATTESYPTRRRGPGGAAFFWGAVLLVVAGFLTYFLFASSGFETADIARGHEREKILADRQAEDQKLLHDAPSWFSKDKGLVRIPIERAMGITVAELSAVQPHPAYPISQSPPQPASALAAYASLAPGKSKAPATLPTGAQPAGSPGLAPATALPSATPTPASPDAAASVGKSSPAPAPMLVAPPAPGAVPTPSATPAASPAPAAPGAPAASPTPATNAAPKSPSTSASLEHAARQDDGPIVETSFHPKVAAVFVPIALQAREEFEHQDYARAESLYTKLLASDPDNAYLLLNEGVVLSREGKLGSALVILEKAVAIAPRDAFGLTVLGDVYLLMRRYDDAIGAYTRALEVEPQNRYVRRNLEPLLILRRGTDFPFLDPSTPLRDFPATPLHTRLLSSAS